MCLRYWCDLVLFCCFFLSIFFLLCVFGFVLMCCVDLVCCFLFVRLFWFFWWLLMDSFVWCCREFGSLVCVFFDVLYVSVGVVIFGCFGFFFWVFV